MSVHRNVDAHDCALHLRENLIVRRFSQLLGGIIAVSLMRARVTNLCAIFQLDCHRFVTELHQKADELHLAISAVLVRAGEN